MNIVTIGGGDRTPAIKKSLELSGDSSRVLIIPSAASTETSYNKNVGATVRLFEDLGVDVNLLHAFGETPSATRVQHEIGSASLVFTVGGNTPHLIQKMHEHGSDIALQEALENDTVHAGGGSGALLPFELAHINPVPKPTEQDWDYDYVSPGINSISGVATIHAGMHDPTPDGSRSDTRLEALMDTFPSGVTRGFALDSGVSAVFGDDPEIIRTRDSANVYYISRTATGGLARRVADLNDLTTR